MKHCVFCGEPGGSEEHIISDSVRKRMQITEVEVEIGVREEEGGRSFRKAHRLERFVTRSICEDCNHGWMSRLEVDFLAAADHLIEPEWPKVEEEFIQEAIKGGEVIGRWAVKTAIAANLASIIKRPIPNEIASNVRLGKLPPQSSVKVAHIRKRDFSMIIHRGFLVHR